MPETKTVSLIRCPDYERANVGAAVERAVDLLGGIDRFVEPGERILIKVNLLGGYPPEKAVTTHPEIVRATIELVRSAGGEPIVGDSPGGLSSLTSLQKALAVSGIGPVCDELGVEFALFEEDVRTLESPQGRLYRYFDAAGILHEIDGVISTPILKTHGFMRFTCSVKVLFGFIVGPKKMEYHFKVPSRRDFAEMLVDLYLAVQPRLTIVDAVVGMEGDGPTHGDPYHLGAVLASADSPAADVIAGKLVGFDPLSVYTTAIAIERGLVDPEKIFVVGEPLEALAVNDFRPSKRDLDDVTPSIFGVLPESVGKTIKNISTARPFLAHPEKCTKCATCYKICPVKAITFKEKKPVFDYATCIRCYCCEELCPEGAIKRRNHWLIRPFARERY